MPKKVYLVLKDVSNLNERTKQEKLRGEKSGIQVCERKRWERWLRGKQKKGGQKRERKGQLNHIQRELLCSNEGPINTGGFWETKKDASQKKGEAWILKVVACTGIRGENASETKN